MENVPRRNWTVYVYKRQLFGTKIPNTGKRRSNALKRFTSSGSITAHRQCPCPLRTFHLRDIIPSLTDLEQVFLGFSYCGNYVFSYLENFTEENDDFNLITMQSERFYTFNVWRFVPGKKLELKFSSKLFSGETFLETLYIRVEQKIEIPDLFVIIGSMASSDTGALSKTLWHTILFVAKPTVMYMLNYHILYGLYSDLRLFNNYLVMCSCDELILMDLKEFRQNSYIHLRRNTDDAGRPLLHMISQSLGDVSRKSGLSRYRFDYANKTIQWCTDTYGFNCVGLSDYHLLVDTISNDIVEGRIFALFDVDTSARFYYEGVFAFRWNLSTNSLQRLNNLEQLCDVTERSKDPGKQQKAFNDLRKDLFDNAHSKISAGYELSNSSVLEGYSLERIFDSTGCIALAL